jgi:exodeoxyribonuclease X
MPILILDTETTGKIEPIEAIEIAYIPLDKETFKPIGEFENRYLPSKPIEYGAMATHHIVMSDLKDCEPSGSFTLKPEVEYLIGHNIDFDWKVIGSPNVKRICTLALARYLLPDLDSHTQSALMYYYIGPGARNFLKETHSALADVRNCYTVLANLIIDSVNSKDLTIDWTLEDLYNLSEKARIPTKITFGKHAGTLIKDLPWDYKQWMLKEEIKNPGNFDPYLIKAIRGK